MQVKRLVLILTMILISIISFSGCSKITNIIENGVEHYENTRSNQLTILTSEEGELIDEMSHEIIRCFTDRDKEALKGLFSEYEQSKEGFDDNIDKAFEFFLCDVYIESEIDRTAGGSMSTREGKRTEWSVWPDIPYISVLVKVDSDSNDYERRYYSIYYIWEIIEEEDVTKEGIQYMEIELLNVDSFEIGINPNKRVENQE